MQDTIGGRAALVVVELRDTVTGAPRAGVPVTFRLPNDGRVATSTSMLVTTLPELPLRRTVTLPTGADGRSSVGLQVGTRTGAGVVIIEVPDMAVADSVPFTILPGAPTRAGSTILDPAVRVGRRVTLGGSARDRGGNLFAVTLQLASATPQVCTVDASGAVVGVAVGRCRLGIRVGDRAVPDSVRPSVVPDGPVLVLRGALSGAGQLGTVQLDGSDFSPIATAETPSATAGAQWLTSGELVYRTASGFVFQKPDGTRRVLPQLPFTVFDARVSGDGAWMTLANVARTDGLSMDVRRVPPGDWMGGTWIVGQYDYGTTHVDISPDGRRVAFGDSRSFLRLYDFTTRRVLTISAQGERTRFSMDGARVAAAGYGGLWVSSVDRDDARLIYSSGQGASCAFNVIVGWSPDAKWLLVSCGFVGESRYFLVSTETTDWMKAFINSDAVLPLPIGTDYHVLGGWKP